jgi:aminoglycoside phosphotransferase (APT) family kinase protein
MVEANEEVLQGGVNTVVRVGATVRRPAGPWTAAVHALLDHLAVRGFAGAPRAHGFDEQGREVLDFVEGEVLTYPLPDAVLGDDALLSVGRLLREYHEATAGFVAPPDAAWSMAPREPAEVLCHGDFAPHNLVFRDGRAAAVIDFDTAHPGPRVWDLGWTACCFGLFPDEDAGARVRRVVLLADGYGLGAGDREALPDAMAGRMRHLAAHIREQAAAGHSGFSRHLAEGHDVRYLVAAEEVGVLRGALVAGLCGG